MDKRKDFYLSVFVRLEFHRDQLLDNARKGNYFVSIDLEDLSAFDNELAKYIRNQPNDYIPKVNL